jgi:cobalt-zinc-cadmium efflux system membrane fusion protein
VTRGWLTGAALLLTACGGQSPPPVEARSPEPAAKAPASEVSVKPDQAGIAVETMREESVQESIRATGRLTVNENQTWRVGAVTEARVVKVAANPGDAVKAGQVLARMHSHDVHEGRAEYRKALNELARARAAEAFAKHVRDRARRLYDLKAAALEQVERTESELRNAQAAVESAETELERTKTHLVEFLQVTLDEPEKHSDGPHTESSHGDEDLIPVKAPAAGTVLERKVTPGSVVAAAAEMFVISDLSTLWMQANIGEASIPRVRPGQSVRVEVQSQPGRSFSGRVIKLGEQLDPATRTLPVRIELANPGGLLKPEMYADAQLAAGGTQRAMYVAESALQEIKGQTVVFVEKSPGQYDARAVETGRSLDGRVALLNGVAAGDRIVVKGAFILKSQLLKKALSEEE